MVRTTKTKQYLKEAKANGEEEPELTPKGQKPRTLTPEHLEKLKLARQKAREAQIKNTEARRKKKEEPKEGETPLVEEMNKIDLSTNEKILEEPAEPEPDLESDEEPEPVVIKKEKKKKPKKKPVVIVEESDSESEGEGNVVYIKRRSNKKKVELPPAPQPEPVKELPQFSYPRNPFYAMPFRML
jgi:hypothetical protein